MPNQAGGSSQQRRALLTQQFVVVPLVVQIVTGKGKVMLMEYGYDSKIMEMFTPFGIDQSKELYLMW